MTAMTFFFMPGFGRLHAVNKPTAADTDSNAIKAIFLIVCLVLKKRFKLTDAQKHCGDEDINDSI
jgi:hypothetical protein